MKRIHLLTSLGLAALALTACVFAGLLSRDSAVFLFVGLGLVLFMASWRLEG